MINRIKPIIGSTVLLAIAFYGYLHGAGSQPRVRDESNHIRVGTNRALGTVTPYVARDLGLFEQQSLQADVIDFNDVTTLMESIASGRLDVALVGISSPAIWQQRGLAVKIVASANGGGHVLLTRTGAGIHSLADLRGRKVATPKPGTVTDTFFRAHLLHDLGGLDPEHDVTIVPDMAAADITTVLFVSHEVDAAISWEPFASQAEAAYPDHVVLYDGAAEWRKLHPGQAHLYPVNVVVASQSFIDQHPDTLRRFLAAYSQAVDYINHRPAEADAIISRETQLDRSVVESARKRIDYTTQVDVGASLETLSWAAQLGYLKKPPSPGALFDLRFLPRGAE